MRFPATTIQIARSGQTSQALGNRLAATPAFDGPIAIVSIMRLSESCPYERLADVGIGQGDAMCTRVQEITFSESHQKSVSHWILDFGSVPNYRRRFLNSLYRSFAVIEHGK
uniref:Uncharacterized protein n=1 Tax=blood disease bacterium R229 TaxID=741978 RepID=G2ZSL6_9RALS|nr:hypothetical protein BDB_180069 [blood disease bacterium R229]